MRSDVPMSYHSSYHTLFELLRQRNLSTLFVSPGQLGLPDTLHPEIADDILRRANKSWAQPVSAVD